MIATSAPAESETLFGHPRGLLYLSFTEVWERFSFYGMQALLLPYMVDQALTPGHIGRIAGDGRLDRDHAPAIGYRPAASA